MEGVPGKQRHRAAGSHQVQKRPELPFLLPCWPPGASLGFLRCQLGTGNTRGQTRCQDSVAPLFLLETVVNLCLPMSHPPHCPNSPSSTHLFWNLLASVSSSTGFRLYLDRQERFLCFARDRGSLWPSRRQKRAWMRASG